MESIIDIINNNSSFFDDKENEYNIEMIDKNNYIVKPKNFLRFFIKLVNIIINDYYHYPNYSHFYNIENIYQFLINKKFNLYNNER